MSDLCDYGYSGAPAAGEELLIWEPLFNFSFCVKCLPAVFLPEAACGSQALQTGVSICIFF